MNYIYLENGYDDLILDLENGTGISTESRATSLGSQIDSLLIKHVRKMAFDDLKRQWLEETFLFSNYSKIINNPSYLSIIRMGKKALPFIFEDWQSSNSHWFFALREITGKNPVKSEHIGNVNSMKQDWIEWAKINGIIDGFRVSAPWIS